MNTVVLNFIVLARLCSASDTRSTPAPEYVLTTRSKRSVEAISTARFDDRALHQRTNRIADEPPRALARFLPIVSLARPPIPAIPRRVTHRKK
ncbi:hypothetical protein [Caballeronia calidae]|uniref:hypothetical protein n=1 Tax=Caballeronia calidae TaxID=1777139 RepID=UPI0012FDD527|nr:hypothetical protein [Caballeronia calidae]